MNITRRTGLKGLIASATSVAMPALVRADEPEIIVGAPNSLTGGLGEIGQRMTWGLQIAIDQINREGGIKSLGGAKLKAIQISTCFCAKMI
jgi:branched-chain amino acid transport system substrate-binding protein